MFTLAFWRATIERALSTAAQAGILSIGQDVVDGVKLDAFHFDWLQLLGYMAGGFALAVLKAVAVAKATDGGPSLGNAETLNPAAPEPAVAVPESDLGAGMVEGVGDIADSVYGSDPKTDATYLGRGE